MKKILFFIFIMISIFGCDKKEYKYIKIGDFIYKTVIWQQYWFKRWDDKVVDKIFNKDFVKLKLYFTSYDSSYIGHKMTTYYIFVDELNSIFSLREYGNNYLTLTQIETDDDLKIVNKTAKEHFFKPLSKYDVKDVKLKNNYRKDIVDNSFIEFNNEKILIVEKILIQFFSVSETFKNKSDGFIRILKNKKAKIRIGNFFINYPDIVFYIDDCINNKPCCGIIQRDVKNELIGDWIYYKEGDVKRYKYTIEQLDRNGAWFVWENNEVRYISDIKE